MNTICFCFRLTVEFSRFCSKYLLVFFIIDGAAISIALLQFNKVNKIRLDQRIVQYFIVDECFIFILFWLKQSMQTGILIDVIRSFIVLCSALGWIYIFCHFGNKVTSAYQELNESIYLCDWHLFPMEIRKYLPILIMIVQKPIYMRGFGFNCTLETFKTVICT